MNQINDVNAFKDGFAENPIRVTFTGQDEDMFAVQIQDDATVEPADFSWLMELENSANNSATCPAEEYIPDDFSWLDEYEDAANEPPPLTRAELEEAYRDCFFTEPERPYYGDESD